MFLAFTSRQIIGKDYAAYACCEFPVHIYNKLDNPNPRCVTQVESYFDYADIMKLLADPNDPKCRHFPVDIDAYNDCVENDSSSNVTECVQQTRADKSVTCEDYAFDDELVTGSGLYSASMQYGHRLGTTRFST